MVVCDFLYISVKMPLLRHHGLSVNRRPVPERGQRHPALLCRSSAGAFAGFPALVDAVKVRGQGTGRPAKAYAPGFGGGNALGLTLADVHALVLRHEGQYLKDNIAQKCPHKGISPHVHHGYFHNENDGPKGATRLSTKERKMVDRVIKAWYNKKSK